MYHDEDFCDSELTKHCEPFTNVDGLTVETAVVWLKPELCRECFRAPTRLKAAPTLSI